MKLYHYLLLFIFLTSCSKDDIPVDIPAEKIKINAISIDNESTYSFNLNGTFTNDEKIKIIESGFVIDTISEPNLAKNLVKVLSPNDNNILKSGLKSLIPNKKLFVKAYIKTENKTYYSEQLIHTTLKDNPFYINEDYTISTQEELLEFASHHYTTIKGNSFNFTITGTVSDLSSLKDLEILDVEVFSINNSMVTALVGLNNVRTAGAIDIRFNSNLLNLNGLDNLQGCNGDFFIISNDNLKTFNSLNELYAINGTLNISANKNLENFNGLNKLKALYEIYITDNAKLKNLVGLSSLQTVAWEAFYITNNQSLESLTGLYSLKKIGQLQIESNVNLKNLKGLESLEEITFFINVHNNPNLLDLTGLSNLKSTEYLSVENNPNILSLSGLNDAVVIDYFFVKNNYNLRNLTKIGSIKTTIIIDGNDNLLSLDGLQNVQTLTGSLNNGQLGVVNNKSLIDLKGLDGLTKVEGYSISIGMNENLTSLHGLEQLERTSSTDMFYIYYNPKLSDFCAVKNYITKTGFSLIISDNLSNPPVQTILNNCP